MLFGSYIFIFLFLPLALGGFYTLKKLNKVVLAKVFIVVMSLWFYGYFNYWYLFVIGVSLCVNYCAYSIMNKFGVKRTRKWTCRIAVLINVGLLFYYKYLDFFSENINSLFKISLPIRNIVLPLGISFFTFQQISFIVDAYRGETGKVALLDYLFFVTFFPQLIAGPIVSHDEMLPQIADIKETAFNTSKFNSGLVLFVLGLSKKMLIADVLGNVVNYCGLSLQYIGSFDTVIYIIFYSFELYFDFSGYSDMARGLGRMFMFELPVNFDSPFKTDCCQAFWRKWHMTLTRFLTKYIYIPLGGNRKGKVRTYINILIVNLVCGIWHGAGWSFVLWGIELGIWHIVSRIVKPVRERIPKFFRIFGTFIIFSFSIILIRGDGMAVYRQLFSSSWRLPEAGLLSCVNTDLLIYAMKVLRLNNLAIAPYMGLLIITVISIACSFILPNAGIIADKYAEAEKEGKRNVNLIMVMASILLFVCIISMSQVSTFLYFNF